MAMIKPAQWFARFAQWTGYAAGTWQAFALAFSCIVAWIFAGFFYGFTNTMYQLAVNSGTTVVTFLMVFVLQRSQNRDTLAIKLQIGELIRATDQARNRLVSLDDLSEDQLTMLAAHYAALAHRSDNGVPSS
jgi:low affinity Fe/Cu permease